MFPKFWPADPQISENLSPSLSWQKLPLKTSSFPIKSGSEHQNFLAYWASSCRRYLSNLPCTIAECKFLQISKCICKKFLLQWSLLSSTTIFLHSEHQIAKCIQLNMEGEKNSVKLQTIFFPTWKSLLLPSSPELSTTIFSHIEHRYISLQIGVTNYWYWGRLGWTKILTNSQWPSCFYRYWKVKVQTCSCDIQMSLFFNRSTTNFISHAVRVHIKRCQSKTMPRC